MNDIKITISLKSIFLIIAMVLLIWGIIVAKDIILFLFAGYIIASALFPIENVLPKRYRKRSLQYYCFY